jgi:hypothetical protein
MLTCSTNVLAVHSDGTATVVKTVDWADGIRRAQLWLTLPGTPIVRVFISTPDGDGAPSLEEYTPDQLRRVAA